VPKFHKNSADNPVILKINIHEFLLFSQNVSLSTQRALLVTLRNFSNKTFKTSLKDRKRIKTKKFFKTSICTRRVPTWQVCGKIFLVREGKFLKTEIFQKKASNCFSVHKECNFHHLVESSQPYRQVFLFQFQQYL